jgi:hypothetical protein
VGAEPHGEVAGGVADDADAMLLGKLGIYMTWSVGASTADFESARQAAVAAMPCSCHVAAMPCSCHAAAMLSPWRPTPLLQLYYTSGHCFNSTQGSKRSASSSQLLLGRDSEASASMKSDDVPARTCHLRGQVLWAGCTTLPLSIAPNHIDMGSIGHQLTSIRGSPAAPADH